MKGAAKSKSEGTIELGGRRIATQRVSGKAPVDASRFLAVVSAGGQVRLIRRVDLVPQVVGAAAATVHLGYNLVDIFTPMYGSYYPLGKPAFIFNEGRVWHILNSVWNMIVMPGDENEQVLNFKIDKNIKANYLKAILGHTISGGHGAVLSVRVDGAQVDLDLTAQSSHFFDLVLPGDGSAVRDVRFMLNIAVNNLKTSVCPIFQVELYDTLRVFPDPTIFA